MLDQLLDRYTEQGRGCGCPGDDFVDDQARYLLGVHRSLSADDAGALLASLTRALRAASEVAEDQLRVFDSRRDGVLPAFAVAGLVLELPEAQTVMDRLSGDLRSTLIHRAETLRVLWRAVVAEANDGPHVLRLIHEALETAGRSLLLSHCDPKALAAAWDLDPSVAVRTMILHLLGDRSEQERRAVESFLERVARDLVDALPGPGRSLHSRIFGWLRRSKSYDRLYLELMRCLPCLSDVGLRRDTLARCASHPSPVVSRRAVRQLFLEAEASNQPAFFRPTLERLASAGPAHLREEAQYAVSLLPAPTPRESLDRLGEQASRRLRSPLRWRRQRRLRERYHLEPMDSKQLQRSMEPGLAPDCAACTDRCCHGPTSRVSLRLADILRLREAGLDHAIETRKPPFTSQEIERSPHLSTFQRDRAYAWFPMLRQKPDGTCVFYGEDGRCGIYEQRPMLCRSFPYQLDLERSELHYSERCPSRRQDPVAAEALADAVAENFNHKIRDLILVHDFRPGLEKLGLLQYLSLEQDPPE